MFVGLPWRASSPTTANGLRLSKPSDRVYQSKFSFGRQPSGDGLFACRNCSTTRGVDVSGIDSLFERSRSRLRRLLQFRMDPRLRRRVDESDIIQEAFVEASNRYEEFVDQSENVSEFVWLRFLTIQKLAQHHRRHFGAAGRDLGREQCAQNAARSNSALIADALTGKDPSPSHGVIQNELREKIIGLLDQLTPIDREVLTLRHFEQLSNQEASESLGISPDATYRRYIRALRHMKTVLESDDHDFESNQTI